MDAILILGAAVTPQGPSPALQRRALHGARLWQRGVAPIVIACGGNPKNGVSEAVSMQQLLIDAGVARNAVLVEDQSRTTLENILFASRMTEMERVVIVTDKYHAPRALMVAKHFNLAATPSCPKLAGLQLKSHFREAFARLDYAIKLRRLPKVSEHLTRD